MKPCNVVFLVTDDFVFTVLTNINVGGVPIHHYISWTQGPLDLNSAIFLVERDIAFEKSFGIQFPRSYISAADQEKENYGRIVAEDYINGELAYIERLNRIVRLNPIFRGRDFMISDSLVFVLCPFSEPFNTIFRDHIKPTVESIPGLSCIRADDIYDNRPIIEDIWKCINEARVIISELTGRNPNVFYETGIAHTVGKEVILISQNIDDVPFDLRHLRCITYDYTPRGATTLENNLRNTINAILSR